MVPQSDDLPKLEVVVGLDTTHRHSIGPSIRNRSSNHGMTRHDLRLVGARSARVCHRHYSFGEGPRSDM